MVPTTVKGVSNISDSFHSFRFDGAFQVHRTVGDTAIYRVGADISGVRWPGRGGGCG